MGSSDETAGCGIFQLDLKLSQAKIRLCRDAEVSHSDKVLTLKNLSIPYGRAQVESALEAGLAITTRLILRQNKHSETKVKLLISIEEKTPQIVTYRDLGAIGIDLNAQSVALAVIKSDGNTIDTKTLPFDLNRKTTEQSKQILSVLAHEIVNKAKALNLPIVRERLDFKTKKHTLGESGTRYASMLSSFAYSQFYSLLDRCAARCGVEVIQINPAFTSVMGFIKFGVNRLTVDEAAAVAIARRGLGFKERLRTRSMSPVLRTKLTQVSGEKQNRHVWSGWKRFYSWLGKDRKVWTSRCSEKERTNKGYLKPSCRVYSRQDASHHSLDKVKSLASASVFVPLANSTKSLTVQ